MKIGYTPTSSGTNSIKITADASGENVYCTGSVNVSDNNTSGNLTITYSVPAANANHEVTGNNLTFAATIKNNLTSTYNDLVIAKLYKEVDNSGDFSYLTEMAKGINLAGSATTTQYFEFKNLESGRYLAVFYYYDQNAQTRSTKTAGYQVGVLKGDVNGDGRVNVSDVTELINMILGVTTMNKTRADVNGDGQVNVSDVTALINLILGVG